MIIVAASTDCRKTGGVIHVDCWIAVSDFEMNSRDAVLASPIEEMVEKQLSDAAALLAGKNCNEEKFGFACDCPEQ